MTEKSVTSVKSAKWYFHYTLWMQLRVPSTFLRGEKFPAIQGDREIGIDWGKLAIKGYFHYTLWTRFRVPSTFLRGEKLATIQGD